MTLPLEPDKERTVKLLQAAKTGRMTPDQVARLQLAQSDPVGQQASILVVDDVEPLRTVMVLTLQGLGYNNVFEAADGEAALEQIRQREFDLIVLDIEMPKLDGFGVLAALKRSPEWRHVPVIVASGLEQLDDVARCIELGAEDFLTKPVKPILLKARISSSLERKRLRDLDRLRVLELEQEKQLLELEQEKSDRLLLNILPRAIAERLKQSERTIAERYAEVTVLFADLVEFTTMSNQMEPEQLVAMLNDLFTPFDLIAERRGLEKIKTVGDSYFVVGGLPERRTDHAEAVADMALEMMEELARLNHRRGSDLRLRIGINSGPVVAGVIGRRKFSYDLWGATVNLASRMQSHGLPGQINVAEATCRLLQGKFALTERGLVPCKGVGDVRAYLLGPRLAEDERRSAPVSRPRADKPDNPTPLRR